MRLFFAFIILLSMSTTGQVTLEKYSDHLKNYMVNAPKNDEILIWIYFKDKGPSSELDKTIALNLLSEKSLKRRAKLSKAGLLVDETDFPVHENYIEQVQSLGFRLKQKSRWFNAVSGYLPLSNLNSISGIPFIEKIDLVARHSIGDETYSEYFQYESNRLTSQKIQNSNIFDYGNSLTQLQQINVPAVHNLGYSGQGVTICVMDAGFDNLTHEVFSSMNIIAAYDIVNNDFGVGDSTDLGEGSHGTATLSAIGGFKEGKLIGPAYGANFVLAKTENTFSETPVEEDNWIAALEWADSIGVDVTSTSLGYTTYDSPFTSYTWENMDGNTARITIAADLAVKKGIVVVNSAGNQGFHSEHNTIGAPSDGDSVIAVGAVNSSGTRTSFSSVGNTVDGRIKPDIMAMGSGVVLASSNGTISYKTGSGTSFSCPLAAGVAALILSYNPSLTPIQVRDLLRNSASRSQNPDREYGWGIIDALKAIDTATPVELTSFNAEVIDHKVHLQWITASEINFSGFSIERSKNNSSFLEIGFVHSQRNNTSKNVYNYADESVYPGFYSYRLKIVNMDGSFEFSPEVKVFIEGPAEFNLSQNYPNPFNPSTKVKYSVPVSSTVKLTLFDVLGKEIARIFEGELEAGEYETAISADAFTLSSGIYFIKLETAGFQKSIKLTLVK